MQRNTLPRLALVRCKWIETVPALRAGAFSVKALRLSSAQYGSAFASGPERGLAAPLIGQRLLGKRRDTAKGAGLVTVG